VEDRSVLIAGPPPLVEMMIEATIGRPKRPKRIPTRRVLATGEVHTREQLTPVQALQLGWNPRERAMLGGLGNFDTGAARRFAASHAPAPRRVHATVRGASNRAG
jgi:hypothetical protein